MTTQEMVKKLMDTMGKRNCTLLQAQSIVTQEHFEKLDTATALIRTAFNTEVQA